MALIRYAEGFPTRVTLPRLDRMLRALGAPTIIERHGRDRLYLEWPPIYPGVPTPSYMLTEPFEDKRRIPIAGVEKECACDLTCALCDGTRSA